MDPYIVRLLLFAAMVATCAVTVRLVLGPAHVRAEGRAAVRARPIGRRVDEAMILAVAPRPTPPRHAENKDSDWP
jgi:hypothetical protein